MLRLLGLGVRSRRAIPGVDATAVDIGEGTCAVAVLAADASRRAEQKVLHPARRAGVPVIRGPLAAVMGARLGRPPVMAVSVRDRALARGILAVVTSADDNSPGAIWTEE